MGVVPADESYQILLKAPRVRPTAAGGTAAVGKDSGKAGGEPVAQIVSAVFSLLVLISVLILLQPRTQAIITEPFNTINTLNKINGANASMRQKLHFLVLLSKQLA
jgi:hypothetical protein